MQRLNRTVIAILGLAAGLHAGHVVADPTAQSGQPAKVAQPSLADSYREAAGRLIGAALVSDEAYETLGYLADMFPRRISGSDVLERAIDWTVAKMGADGLQNAHEESVMVPAWVRGKESARLIAPIEQELVMLGLGGSIGTPPGGFEADVVVVSSFDELDALGRAGIEGKIVLYDVPFTEYGETVKYRGSGASRAAAHGAVAALVRSVGPASLSTPHTGGMSYTADLPKIPAAAITIEAATMLHRMQKRGTTPRIHLEMAAAMHPDRPSANAIAEIVGRELPDEVVVIGGHIDAWDVGQGAQDDGAGCVIAWSAARLIQQLGLKPRRTIRVVLFTNEENGSKGAEGYVAAHRGALDRHVAVIESDLGNGLATGYRVEAPSTADDKMSDADKAAAKVKQEELAKSVIADLGPLAPLFAPMQASRLQPGYSGADVGQIVKHGRGVVGFGLDHPSEEYFKIHHTPADTFEKIDKIDLNKNVATMAVMAFILADMPGRLLPVDVLDKK